MSASTMFAPNRRSRLSAALLAVTLVFGSVASASSAPRRSDPTPTAAIDPALVSVLDQVPADASVSVIVVLRDQLDPAKVTRKAKESAAAAIVRSLRDHARGRQAGLEADLRDGKARNDVLTATPLWIVNAIAVTARPGYIRRLATRPEVASVLPDNTLLAPPPAAETASAGPEPNIALVGAPALWTLGFRGAGVTIASLDTGVDGTHLDLAAQWRGDAGAWFDPYGQHASPVDMSGHGTQTMGVIVGRSAGGTAIGVAPDATWIAAKIFNDSGTATSTAIHLAFQWALDPDGDPQTADTPAVVNNSWTLGAPGCSTSFEPDLAALVAAGITPVFAAGNFGPGSNSSVSPANNPDAFAVGAVDNGDLISASSSRGPTSCGRGASVTWPALTAPGVAVRSADRGGMYATSTGTSIAAPHVTGAIALLRQAVPGATSAQIRDALVLGARDLGTAGADSVYGAGRLDVAAAYARLTGGPATTPTPTPSATPTATPAATPTATPTASPSQVPSPTATPTPIPTAPVADSAGPITDTPVLGPNPASGAVAVAVGASASDATSGGSNLTAAEWFLDVAGAAGSGSPMSGAFVGVSATISGSIPTVDLAALTSGSHAVLVRSRDAAGNWGPLASSSLVIDRTGPSATGGAVAPNTTQGAAATTLTGTLSDSTSGVISGEWFVDVDPGPGNGTPLLAVDGAFDGSSELVRGPIPTAGGPFGERIVSFRGRDGAGTWGPVATTSLLVTPADGVFADGFESGAADRWTSRTGGTRLTVTGGAAMAGRWGLAVTVSGGTTAYVTDTTPAALMSYHARFGLDAGSLVTSGKVVDLFVGLNARGGQILGLEYRRSAGSAGQVRVGALRGNSLTWSAWTTLVDGRHTLELAWLAASNGSVGLSIDGLAAVSLTSIDSRSSALETVRLGPSKGLTTSITGQLHFDRFVSTRGSAVGP